jgi:hypothetical protein
MASTTDSTVHEIVPNPDVIITLAKPLSGWPELGKDVSILDGLRELDLQDDYFRLRMCTAPELSESDSVDSTGQSEIHQQHYRRSISWLHVTGLLTPITASNSTVEAEEPQFRFGVYAGALMAASPLFNDLLRGVVRDSDGIIHITAQRLHPTALLNVLCVMHHRTRAVPKCPNIGDLAELALVVNASNCELAVDTISDIWCKNIEDGSLDIPNLINRDSLLLMWVSYVFRREELFKKITSAILRHATDEAFPNFVGLPLGKLIGE